jgi:formiminoglutamate deiminase
VSAYLCEHAWLGGSTAHDDVLVEVDGGRIAAVTTDFAGSAPRGVVRLTGLTVPGLANVHSHAFHRALRGRTHAVGRGGGGGSFWTWREQMYGVAERLDPSSYLTLATAVYAEMALAGVTAVGEFHYLHHGPGGKPYDDPNSMAHALVEAARTAGVRLTLLDTCYLTGGVGQPLGGVQARFGDGTAQAWAERASALHATYASDPRVVVGAAVHSVRAVPAAAIPVVGAWAREHEAAPLHAHVSEQPAENEACLAAYNRTPTQLLADCGALGPGTTAVHATHLTAADVTLLGETQTGVCFCPTTERDLADGTGPVRPLLAAGTPLSLGSDSHAVIDMFEEARAVELDERLVSLRRGHLDAASLLTAATANGWAALGRPSGGAIRPGAPADLVSLRLDSPRTAGTGVGPEVAVFAATAADVHHVVVGGEPVVSGGVHVHVPDVGKALADGVAAVLR